MSGFLDKVITGLRYFLAIIGIVMLFLALYEVIIATNIGDHLGCYSPVTCSNTTNQSYYTAVGYAILAFVICIVAVLLLKLLARFAPKSATFSNLADSALKYKVTDSDLADYEYSKHFWNRIVVYGFVLLLFLSAAYGILTNNWQSSIEQLYLTLLLLVLIFGLFRFLGFMYVRYGKHGPMLYGMSTLI